MARRTYLTREVEAEYEIDIDDIIEFINKCTEDEELQIKKALMPIKHPILGGDLYDDMKIDYLKQIFEKYSLDELKTLAIH